MLITLYSYKTINPGVDIPHPLKPGKPVTNANTKGFLLFIINFPERQQYTVYTLES